MAAEKRVAELKEKDISEYFIVQEAGANQYAISLGLFKNETSAQTHLANIKLKGIHDAAIVPRNSPTGVSIELRATPDLMKPLLKDLKRKYRNARHTPCK